MKTLDVLIIEDNKLEAKALKSFIEQALSKRGRVFLSFAMTEAEAEQMLALKKYDLALIDIDLDKRKSGFRLLEKFRSQIRFPVIASSHESEAYVQEAYSLNCEHYFKKPSSMDKIQTLAKEFFYYLDESKTMEDITSKFITQDAEVKSQLLKIVKSKNIVTHIQGPTGVGKQVIAELIHDLHAENKSKFYEINCATINSNLAESTLFGHKKGSYTGANFDKQGLFELANGGTIFLDEIEKTSLEIQAKLLKVIETKKFKPLGSDKVITAELQIVSASSENLEKLVRKGLFLEDLWQRLQGEVIEISPLNQRKSDIEYQLKHFIKNHPSGRLFLISDEALEILKDYDWSGNTRELIKFIDRFQRKGARIVEPKHLDFLQKKQLKSKYLLLNDEIVKMVSEKGMTETLDLLAKEIVDFSYISTGKSVRKAMRKLDVCSRKFYKYFNNNKEGEGVYASH